MAHELSFHCPLPNGLHARPASLLAEAAGRFDGDVTLIHERTGAVANAKSVLALVALDVKQGDACRVRCTGADSERAHSALRSFAGDVLPTCDEPLPATAPTRDVQLPRALRDVEFAWHAGTIVSPGVGEGVVVVAGGLVLPAEIEDELARSVAEERMRVRDAVASVRASLSSKLASRPSSVESAILLAHLSIVGDVGLGEKVDALLVEGRSAGRAIVEAGRHFAAQLASAGSAYVRERAADVEDIALQLLEELYGERARAVEIALDRPSIVAAESITPRQLLALDRELLAGLVLEQAGVTSHAVILARSFGVPTLTGVEQVRAKLLAGAEALVDANLGIVIPSPGSAVRRHYEREKRKLARRRERLACSASSTATTKDGVRIEIAANVATAEELTPAFEQGADGVGLFRTEMLFMDRDAPPSEDEQLSIYARAARAAGNRPVIIRTLDVGGDKPVAYLGLPHETNPFLGYRGVRIYREHRAIFRTQLRAIVRAAAHGNVWIMLPMIASLDEVRWARGELESVRAELASERLAHGETPLGIMIEVPSAAFAIAELATAADFFSVGTNDLAQYFFAVDRDSEKVASLASARHPAFLRLLARIVADARAAKRWIGTCGEMTRSPRNLALLVGLGFDELSTAAPEIPAVKSAIAALEASECRALLDRALACATTDEVEAEVAAFRRRATRCAITTPELVSIASDGCTKAEAIGELVDLFHAAGRCEDPLAIEDAVWAREAVYSTGLGHGFAIPHCKTDAIAASSIGVLRLERPVDWGSLDGAPVRCVILLATRASDEEGAHMKVFARLARKLMHDEFRERLLAASSREALVACLEEELGLREPA